MLIIPLPWNREKLEDLRNENDLFDLIMEDGTQQYYLIVIADTLIWRGQGSVPRKVAYQIKSRTMTVGESAEIPISLGNVGFGGTFSSIEEAICKDLPQKGYCIDDMRISTYSGQKIRGNKLHYNVIEPILCLLDDNPSERFKHFLQQLGYKGRIFECFGEWEHDLSLFIDGEACPSLEYWLINFYRESLIEDIHEVEKELKQDSNEKITMKDGVLFTIGMIILACIIKSCFGG